MERLNTGTELATDAAGQQEVTGWDGLGDSEDEGALAVAETAASSKRVTRVAYKVEQRVPPQSRHKSSKVNSPTEDASELSSDDNPVRQPVKQRKGAALRSRSSKDHAEPHDSDSDEKHARKAKECARKARSHLKAVTDDEEQSVVPTQPKNSRGRQCEDEDPDTPRAKMVVQKAKPQKRSREEDQLRAGPVQPKKRAQKPVTEGETRGTTFRCSITTGRT